VVIKDVDRGLKEDRKGLKKLIELTRRKKIDAIVVTYKDRLAVFHI